MKLSYLKSSICNFQFAVLITAVLGIAASVLAAPPLMGMLELSFPDRKIEGAPINWNEDTIHLLGRDGWLWDINPAEVLTAVQKADIAFKLMLQVRNKLVQAYEEVQAIRV